MQDDEQELPDPKQNKEAGIIQKDIDDTEV